MLIQVFQRNFMNLQYVRATVHITLKMSDESEVIIVGEEEQFGGNEQLDFDCNEAEDEDIVKPTAEQLEQRRQANIEALVLGNLEIQRKPLLPKLLSVSDAAVILKRPFKSPHPNAPARSEALKKALVARKQFIPWGSGKPFVPPKIGAFVRVNEEPITSVRVEVHPPVVVELPEGIEPLVLWEPSQGEEGTPIIVDNALTQFLRPHQREGVQFMFECVCGLRDFDGRGALLCDDMGLGKTLQGIALLWTLLTSGHSQLGGNPVVKRAIITCPTSLVSNWDSECAKWLNGRVRTLALCEAGRDEASRCIARFLSPQNPYHVMIVSYETFRIHAEKFEREGTCDLLICDEAHRLKNDQTLTNRALAAVSCRRRVLLSGTPLQNQLQEFYAMVSFANPGILGSPSSFRKRYEAPILAGREPDAPDEVSTRGLERSAELSEVVNAFILRRTNALLSAHLPPKVVQIVCCRLSPLQKEMYSHFLESRSVQSLFSLQKAARVLSAITSLRKLVNHPKLIYDMLHSKTDCGGGKEGDGFETCAELIPPGLFDGGRAGRGGPALGWEETSGKFATVASMLHILRTYTKDRIVIVSNFTQTLELFSTLCRERRYPCLRLDGSTTINKRQKLVKEFNDQTRDQFVFLLSSKAGGCGLNLIGGNRLILYDASWNPAEDKQAAARVWRDGQKKQCYVYRFMATGTIDEKVYQRQLSKEGLQAVVDSAAGGGGGNGTGGKKATGPNLMSTEELRDLFSYDPDTLSNTYDSMVVKPLLKNPKRRRKADGPEDDDDGEDEDDICIDLAESSDEEAHGDGDGDVLYSSEVIKRGQTILKYQAETPAEEDLKSWGHHSDVSSVPDQVVQRLGNNHISFVFSCKVAGRDVPPEAALPEHIATGPFQVAADPVIAPKRNFLTGAVQNKKENASFNCVQQLAKIKQGPLLVGIDGSTVDRRTRDTMHVCDSDDDFR